MSEVWKQDINLIQWTHNFYKTAHKVLWLGNSHHVQDTTLHLITLYISDNNSDYKSEII